MAFDEITGDNAVSKVVRLFRNETTTWYEVSAGGDKVKATANHPFYVVADGLGCWIAAKELKPGMKLRGIDAQDVKIDDIRILELETAEITYNFEVAQVHSYYVGTIPVLVHNSCKGADSDSILDSIKTGRTTPNSIQEQILISGVIHPYPIME